MSIKKKNFPFQNIIKIKREKIDKHLFDVQLSRLDEIKKFHSLECSIFVYPFSRKINAANVAFNPFEEYVKDILSDQQTAYNKIFNHINNIFGLSIGLLIIGIFYIFKPEELFSVEAIVSVFGSYMLGKELWNDIESLIIRITRKLPIRLEEEKYAYRLERRSMLARYTFLAKKERYGISTYLPEKMHFIAQSNSQTVRMFFKTKDLQDFNSKKAHILTMRIDPELLNEFNDKGFMLTVRLNFNRKILWWIHHTELYQTVYTNNRGCLDERGNWHAKGIFYKQFTTTGRIRHYLAKEVMKNEELFTLC